MHAFSSLYIFHLGKSTVIPRYFCAYTVLWQHYGILWSTLEYQAFFGTINICIHLIWFIKIIKHKKTSNAIVTTIFQFYTVHFEMSIYVFTDIFVLNLFFCTSAKHWGATLDSKKTGKNVKLQKCASFSEPGCCGSVSWDGEAESRGVYWKHTGTWPLSFT